MFEEQAEQIAASVATNSDGLPLWQSRPGANIALFVDYDGGYYSSSNPESDGYYSPASLDSDQGSFDYEERVEMIRAGLELAHYYRFFDVNVTTDEDAAKDTGHYAWIVVTNDEGSGGWAKKGVLDYNPQPSGPRGVAGSDGVLGASTSRRGYLLAHEFGHMFGLEHNGIINGSGNFVEYSDWDGAESIGAIMGGRSSQFDGYRWRQLWTDEHDPQDSMAIIGALAGFVDDGGDCHTEPLYDSDYCTSDCPCDEGEGDCDNDSQCTGDLVCVQYSGTDYCEAPSSPPPSDCHTEPLYDSDYCTSDCPCDEGEGDCDNDSQCTGDLVCVQYSGTDYCEAPSSPPPSDCHTVPLYDSDYCTSDCPCDEGEGDCDNSSQCAGDLVCVQYSGTDYCEAPSSDCHTVPLYDSDYCTSDCPCDEGEGDCDNSSQCAGDLVCVQYSGTDYCEQQ